MDKAIKPCFCGNTSIRVKWHVGIRLYSLWCPKCKREIIARSKKEAISLWNKR
jgi:predicted RNA-binding Zn-ribbon protein involved in translation (DUF1610 family)